MERQRLASPGVGLDAGGQPNDVTIASDPSGRYLLLTYGGRSGFYTGWIDDSKLRLLPITQLRLLPITQLRLLPITQPYLEFPIPTW